MFKQKKKEEKKRKMVENGVPIFKKRKVEEIKEKEGYFR